MEYSAVIVGILGALLLGAASPGPSFVIVAKTSVTLSRKHGLAAACGMGAGGFVFGVMALLGLHTLLNHVTWLYKALAVLGSLYLLYLSYCLCRDAKKHIEMEFSNGRGNTTPAKAMLTSFGVQISNPKTIIVYGSIFMSMLPTNPATWLFFVLPPLIFVVEASWYACVALVFSAGSHKAAYLRSKKWIDYAAAIVMSALGIRLILEAIFLGTGNLFS